MPTQDNFPLSPSEKQTLRYIAEGELHPRELDWLALERLKQAGLLQARPQGLQMRADAPCSGSWQAAKLHIHGQTAET
jgi:hypothetical protein